MSDSMKKWWQRPCPGFGQAFEFTRTELTASKKSRSMKQAGRKADHVRNSWIYTPAGGSFVKILKRAKNGEPK